MKSIKPRLTHTIRDLEALKALADPLRSHIIEALIHETLPVKQIALRLGLAPNKLYYHVNMLEQRGLIQVAGTRIVSGIQEKQYRAVAYHYLVDPTLLSPSTSEGRENIHTILSSTIDTTREDLLRSLEARYFDLDRGRPTEPRRVMITRCLNRLPDSEAHEFLSRLHALTQEFEQAAPEPDLAEPEAETYALMIAFYPSFHYSEERPDAG